MCRRVDDAPRLRGLGQLHQRHGPVCHPVTGLILGPAPKRRARASVPRPRPAGFGHEVARHHAGPERPAVPSKREFSEVDRQNGLHPRVMDVRLQSRPILLKVVIAHSPGHRRPRPAWPLRPRDREIPPGRSSGWPWCRPTPARTPGQLQPKLTTTTTSRRRGGRPHHEGLRRAGEHAVDVDEAARSSG